MNPPLRLHALVSPAERLIVEAIARELADMLGADPSVAIAVHEPGSDTPAAPGAIALVSLLDEASRLDEPISVVADRCARRIAALTDHGCAAVFLVNLFHHVASDAAPADRAAAARLRERIRRLNVMVAYLSRDTGAGVVDIDRVFTLLGASMLQTDYRLGGSRATLAAAHTAAWALLSFGLDESIPIEAQERAKEAMGGAQHVGRLVRRLRGLAGQPVDG